MAINTFDIDPESVRAQYFPASDEWSTESNPSTAVVDRMITEEAGRLAGALNAEAIDAEAIVDDTSPAYVQCAKVLRKQVAIEVTQIKTGIDPELVKAWRAGVDAWYAGLAEGGATFLGGGAISTTPSDPDGPTSHITQFGLRTDEARLMSSTVPFMRKDDQL